MPHPSQLSQTLRGVVDRVGRERVTGRLGGISPTRGGAEIRIVLAGRSIGTTRTPDASAAPASIDALERTFTADLRRASIVNALARHQAVGEGDAEQLALEVVAISLDRTAPAAASLSMPEGFSRERDGAAWREFFGLDAGELATTQVLEQASEADRLAAPEQEAAAEQEEDWGAFPDDPTPVELPYAGLERAIAALADRREDLAGLHERILDEYRREIAERGINVLCLDVFDTVLLRDDTSEARRFLQLSERAAVELGAAGYVVQGLDLLLARAEGMAFSYRTRPAVDGVREGSIDEVYRAMCISIGLPLDAVDVLREVELDHEGGALTANAPLVELARQFRAEGGTVLLLSDMYLHGTDIAGIVERVVTGDPFYDELYSSADAGRSKASGTLFTHVNETLEQLPDVCLHIGDNIEGDYRRPKQAGWHARLFPVAEAEMRRRRDDLDAFIREMYAAGIDVRRWAKT